MEKVTIDGIIDTLIEWTENKVPISPDRWIDAALKLNLLKGDLSDKIIDLQQYLAAEKIRHLEQGKSVAYARTMVEGNTYFAECRKMEAKVRMIEEQIRLAKVRGRMAADDYNSH